MFYLCKKKKKSQKIFEWKKTGMYYNPHVTDKYVLFREVKALAQGPTAN